MLMTRAIAVALFPVLVLAPLSAASAQVARGTVTERGTGESIPGVLVSLVDEQGRIISTVFSDEQGAYEVAAPGAGSFAIEAKRIGVRHLRGAPFTLAAGESRHENIVLDPVVSVLAGMRVSGKSKCVARPRDDARTAALWEDARAALTATVLTARRPLAGTTTRFVRELTPENRRVLRDERHNAHGDVSRPFVSIPVEQLSREGYAVRREDGSTDYYAPDADALLSEAFLTDHCFRFVAGREERVGMVGLGFEPVRGRRVPDVEGVLWLDAATSELERIEFTYVALPSGKLGGKFGGEVHFTRLPTGRWIVDSWIIRMPVIGVQEGSRTVLPGAPPVTTTSREMLMAVREEGGTVLLDPTSPPPRRSVTGVVFDSGTGMPAVGATVSIEGTSISAMTGQDGRFEIRGVPQGLYSIVVRVPALDSLGVPGPADTVRITARGGPDMVMTIPPRAALAARMCPPGKSADERRAVVRVIVVDSVTGESLRDAAARVWWNRFTGAVSTRNLAEHVDGFATRLDSLGSFVACDLPVGELLHVESPHDAEWVWSDTLRVALGEVGWRVLRVSRSKKP